MHRAGADEEKRMGGGRARRMDNEVRNSDGVSCAEETRGGAEYGSRYDKRNKFEIGPPQQERKRVRRIASSE